MFTWTNQPYESMWNHLRLLKISKNVEGLLTGTIKSNRQTIFEHNPLVERKSKQIAHSIRQADEYFAAADIVSISTSPLLYFYGMLSLAKAAIVANHEHFLLDDVKYHGLYTRPITEKLRLYTENHENWKIEEEYAVTNDGVIDVFLRTIHGITIPSKSIIKFKDILKINPEIGEIYNRYYDEPPSFFPLYSAEVTQDPFSIKLYPETKDKEIFLNSFGYITDDFEITDKLLHEIALTVKNKTHLENLPNYMGIYNPIPGGQFLVSGLEFDFEGNNNRKYIPPEACDYIGMFILGDLVRYKQEFWGKTIMGEVDGSIALLNLFVSIARNRFPNYILNSIFGEKFEYGSSARLM